MPSKPSNQTGPPPVQGKKYFSTAEANACLPLLRSILKDVVELARELRDRHERLSRIYPPDRSGVPEAYEEEIRPMQAEMERAQERMQEFVTELSKLGVELKDFHTGLIDFPAWMNGHEVYLCWRLGEPAVAHWHELDAGFAGRMKLAGN